MLEMDYSQYGLLQADGKRYEKIIVSGSDTVSKLTLKEPLKWPYTVNASLCRVIFGSVTPDGDYLLRIRDDSSKQSLLVRYTVKGETYFQQIDLNDPENNSLDISKAVSGEPETKTGE